MKIVTATSSSQHSGGVQSVPLQVKRRKQVNQSKRGIFFFLKQCSSSTSRLSFWAAQQTTSQPPFSSPGGKALWSAVQCDAALGRGKHSGTGLRSMWRSHPQGHFFFTHRRPRGGESPPPAPREHSTGCLPVSSWKPTLSLGACGCREEVPTAPSGTPSPVLPSPGQPGGRGSTPNCSTGRLLVPAPS